MGNLYLFCSTNTLSSKVTPTHTCLAISTSCSLYEKQAKRRNCSCHSALTSFSNHVHILYPILHTKFTDQFLHAIAGLNFPPSSSSCLSLLVIAIGSLFTNGDTISQGSLDQAYIKAALTMLPSVLLENSAESVQCLILFSIFYCCLVKPCQGYDFIIIASFKVRNILRRYVCSQAIE